MNGTRSVLPPEFWSRPDIASALASCDVPALMSAIRTAHGWTQRELAAVLGYSQTWVSRGDAARGDPQAADSALSAAEKLAADADTLAPPPWPWVFPFDAAKLAAFQALTAIRLRRPAQAADAFTRSLTTVSPAPKQAAVLALELAELRRQQGEIDQAAALASQALATGRTHASERVIAKARQFRRACAAHPASALRGLDHQLRETTAR